MYTTLGAWDYLIVTASNELQSAAYRRQLDLRRKLGMLSGFGQVLVVPDPDGRRIGSGGSTIACLLEVLGRELSPGRRGNAAEWRRALERSRILILHAGGDSRRLPAYAACGKIFLPVPGDVDGPVGPTLFDRQLPAYRQLPPMGPGVGQVVIASGDVLLGFDPADVHFAPEGLTGLACHGTPDQAARHGVFCADTHGAVQRYLQKPSPADQIAAGAVDRYGRAAVDIGVMNFDAATAIVLLELCRPHLDPEGRLAWAGPVAEAVEAKGVDFYREICCALGAEATPQDHAAGALGSGSKLDADELAHIFQAVHTVPFAVQVLPRCQFLHFGTTRQIITSGADLLRQDRGVSDLNTCLELNVQTDPGGEISGAHAWIEGSHLRAPLTLGGQNLLVGVDVDQPLTLPAGACLDVLPGRDRNDQAVWFTRCYGVADTFKGPVDGDGTFCGLSLAEWLRAVGAEPDDVWDPDTPPADRTLWTARVFPAGPDAIDYRRWVWMFDPVAAADPQRRDWRSADRYSLEEMSALSDLEAFEAGRDPIRATQICGALRRLFRNDSGFSAAELAHVLARSRRPATIVADLIAEARWHAQETHAASPLEAFVLSRILHTLGSALAGRVARERTPLESLVPGLREALRPEDLAWAAAAGLRPTPDATVGQWAARMRSMAFEHLHQAIVRGAPTPAERPSAALRSDEIVWGRAPARLDLAGGWTDTPPYALERGGRVLNAAVNLNGQPPIHCYGRVIEEPVIRIGSIDLGLHIEISRVEDLLDYHKAVGGFALAKAALVLSGLDPRLGLWGPDATLTDMLQGFGGGIELTTLAAIPKGSGLGTSSIVGAVILAVARRLMGRTLTPQELFHGVLRLEQALTTGGGWQDQIGGGVDGVKLIATAPGLVPDATFNYVPADVLDPQAGGATLLYYTGITRLAKNILQQVVGRYLNRNRATMATLGRIRALAPAAAEVMARKDPEAFGEMIDAAWRLNKELDPGSSNAAVEDLLVRIRPHVWGAKLLGAGGGGFLLMVCKSPRDAAAVRRDLQSLPPNSRARFFDFEISTEGLVVTVC